MKRIYKFIGLDKREEVNVKIPDEINDWSLVPDHESMVNFNFSDHLNDEHIPEKSFVSSIFKKPLFISASMISKNAFINCVFEEYVTLFSEFNIDIFNNCSFRKGIRVLKLENQDTLIIENVDDPNINSNDITFMDEVIHDDVYSTVLQTDIIPSGSFKNKRFLNQLEIIANEVCNMAFDNCIFEDKIILYINTYDGDIFHNCIFMKDINFKPISEQSTPSSSSNTTPKTSKKTTPTNSLPHTPPTSANNTPPSELEMSIDINGPKEIDLKRIDYEIIFQKLSKINLGKYK